MTSEVRNVVIVGTGAAGYAVAEGLHSGGFSGDVTLVGEELGDPYDRPPLSKEILAGTWEPERAALLASKRVAPLNPTIRAGVAATGVDTAGHQVFLSDGTRLDYDALVVATGVTPRTLPHPRTDTVHVLRTMQHSLALRAQLAAGSARFVVIGGGFLGLEAAATARKLGNDVTVVEPIPGPPLASRIAEPAASKLLGLHKHNGVDVRTGIGVDAIESSGGATAVALVDGATLEADVVLIAIGATPSVAWLDDSGLDVSNGLVCDEFCFAGQDVWGAGDVASWLHVGYRRRLRLEHRTNAQEQGQLVARNVLGAREPFTPVPYFWTDHYDVRVQLAGVIPPGAEGEVVEGDPDGASFVQTFSEEGRVQGVLGWNAARQMASYRRQLSTQ